MSTKRQTFYLKPQNLEHLREQAFKSKKNLSALLNELLDAIFENPSPGDSFEIFKKHAAKVASFRKTQPVPFQKKLRGEW